MNELSPLQKSNVFLIRVTFLGQALAYIWSSAVLGFEDAPNIFTRIDIGSFFWPILVILLVFIFKLDIRSIRFVSGPILVLFVAILTISTMVIAIYEVIFSFDIPKELVTPSWQYSQITSVITLGIYSVLLVLVTIYSAKILRKS